MRSIPGYCRLPLLVLLSALALAGCKDKNRTAYALTSNNTLIKFETKTPQTIKGEATVSGLGTGETLLQIDYRPGNKTMYGITTQPTTTTNADGTTTSTQNYYLVSVNPDNGVVSKVSTTPIMQPTTLVQPVVMDINPVGDYLRLIDYAGSTTSRTNNFQVSFAGVARADLSTTSNTALYYNDNDTNSGQIPELAAFAHNNNVAGASATTLYGLDVTTQSLVTIAANQLRTIANCGHAFVSGNAGFDIVPDSDQAFAVLGGVNDNAVFYNVNLGNCNLDRVDEIGGARRILSLAVTLDDNNDKNDDD